MADPKEKKRMVILDWALWRKWNKFAWSGLALVGIGLIVISLGLLLQMGSYSPKGLVVGLGAILIIIGIVRLLIGLINPLAPNDLNNIPAPEERDLDDVVFKAKE